MESPANWRSVERRHLTILFSDIVGSTAISARLDPEALHEILDSYRVRCARTITSAGGKVAQFLGDGVLAYFGFPVAEEDDAERAVEAGLALIDAVRLVPDDMGAGLQARVGLASGLVLVAGDAAHDPVGETPNLAARLQALAEPNTVVISADTRRLIGDLFECEPLGPQILKGFALPVEAWRVVGRSTNVNRFQALLTANAQLVGRGEETDLMMRAGSGRNEARGRSC